MITLYHHPFCPHSRFIRLALGEFGIEPALIEERPWERRREFLLLSAEGVTPVMAEDNAPSVPGADVIAEYLDETRGLGLGDRRLMPDDPLGRAEVRRLMRWFNVKFFAEVEPIAGDGEDLQALHVGRSTAAAGRIWRRCAPRAPICAIICATSGISSAPATGSRASG